MIRQTEIDFFNDQGYLLLGKVLSDDEIAELRAVAERELEHARATGGAGQWDLMEQTREDAPPAVFRLSRVAGRHEAFLAAARHPRVADAVTQVLGGGASLCVNRHNMMVVKAPRRGRRIEWHQDGQTWGSARMVTYTVFLDDATIANGCLQVIPGGHRQGMLSNDGWGMDTAHPDVEALVRQAVPVQARAGEGLLFHSCLPHFSEANRSGHGRRNLVFAYVAADGQPELPTGMQELETLPLRSRAGSTTSAAIGRGD